MRADSMDPVSKANNLFQDAADNDSAMLVALDTQLGVAAKRLREGHAKQALELLRRAHKLASRYEAPSPQGQVPLVVRLASATVRLQTCCSLSHLGEHHRALQEADVAKKELDSIWWTMVGATKEAEVLSATGDFLKLDAVLQMHIKSPPRWLPRVIDTAIQARLCRAVELEYVASDSELLIAVEASAALDNRKPLPLHSRQPTFAGKEGSEEFLPRIGMPLARPSLGQDLAQEHHQAWQLCLSLLPRGHPIRQDAEKAILQARVRWQTVAGSAGEADPPSLSGMSSSHALGKSFSEPTLIRAPADLPPIVGPTKQGQSKNSLDAMHGSKDSWNSAWSVSTAYNKSISGFLSDSSVPSMDEQQFSSLEWTDSALPGAIFSRTLPSSLPSRKSSSDPNRVSPKKQKGAAAWAASLDSAQKEEEPDKNIFADWLKNNLHKDRMTGFQHKLMSYEGISNLQSELRRERNGFRKTMSYMDDERLAEFRLLYSDHGVQATRIGKKRAAAMRKTSIRVSAKAKAMLDNELEIYQYYGLEVPEGSSTVQSLRKLMEACSENAPDKVRMRKQRLEERQKEKEREKLRKQMALPRPGGGSLSTSKLLFAASKAFSEK
eukprot:TRINITY_DN88205_c0_g1_i1.p1 TRINITY_DN88205_c0_g1~~TRINITY_DN88205_c0_g1_i1.p1  ORF type:complete len:650 (-),score=136.86 TRINITY_DN88205_c0_g1_i1:252-2075(-)